MFFQEGDASLVETVNSSSHSLHEFSKLLTHSSEVAFHLLHEYALAIDKLKVLDVHLVEDESLHTFYITSLLLVNSGNHHLL